MKRRMMMMMPMKVVRTEDDTPNPWNYVKMIPSKNPKKKDQFQCIKCFSVFSGGATRIK